MSVCASVQLEMHRPENTNDITMYGHLHVLYFILYLGFTASLYDQSRDKMPLYFKTITAE